MTTEEFNHVVFDRCEKIRAVLEKKAAEYARVDRLSNFKRAAEIERCTPEKAWLGMVTKHLVSIIDMVEDIERTKGLVSWNRTLWDEKIGDTINYFILLEALVTERLLSVVVNGQPAHAAPAEIQKRPHAKPHRR